MTENLWFLNTLVSVRVPHAGASDGVSVLESRAPRGDSPPLHVHDEDEIFHVIEGVMRLRAGGDEIVLRAGETFNAPRGIAHSYIVVSEEARWLVITAKGRFESFVRSFSRPAPSAELPEAAGPPSAAEAEALAVACRAHGIELVGPPLH